jgi:peptidase YpeB-like protein
MRLVIVALPALVLTGLAYSAVPSYHRDIPASLASEAKISEDAALSAALNEVPRGKVISIELEREKGQLLYSVDIKVPKKGGVEEIHVSAVDGRVLSRQHESAKTERKEAAAEKKEREQKPAQ